jgi:hypothetical protein
MLSKIDLNGRVVVSLFGAEKRPRATSRGTGYKVPTHAGTGTTPPLSLLRVHIPPILATTRKPQQGWASQAGPNPYVVWRYLAGALRPNGPAVATYKREHDMATSEPVKTILVVDLTHVPPNDPFATTILGDLRARLIPPTRVGGPNGQPPESSHLLARPARSDHGSERAGGDSVDIASSS